MESGVLSLRRKVDERSEASRRVAISQSGVTNYGSRNRRGLHELLAQSHKVNTLGRASNSMFLGKDKEQVRLQILHENLTKSEDK
jgi:hypothetical protein